MKSSALSYINTYEQGDLSVLREQKWLQYLVLTNETNVNLERVESVDALNSAEVLQYVKRTLVILEQYHLPQEIHSVIEDTLKWSEVAKCGLPHKRRQWMAKGYNLAVHNEGSADIYRSEHLEGFAYHRLVELLIRTHGLFGQVVRGEVALAELRPLTQLVRGGTYSPNVLRHLLHVLNHCVIGAVSDSLWQSVESEITELEQHVVEDNYTVSKHAGVIGLIERMKKLRAVSIAHGEDFDELIMEESSKDRRIFVAFGAIFRDSQLWYVEAALHDFTLEEFIKMFMLVWRDHHVPAHISFEHFMREIYYDHDGKKKMNLYKKRVIESYLREMSYANILDRNESTNQHVTFHAETQGNTLFFTFKFSPAAQKLIEFCVEAEKSGVLYERAIILLYDLFGFRRDAYDRFHNESEYLETMNKSADYKKVMLDYVVGDTVIDIGPGGGVMLDLIEETFPDKTAIGIDISHNVIDALRKKRKLEHRKWDVRYGDALNLPSYVEPGSIHTILFSSIIHELYSYVPFDGRQFNIDTVRSALKSAWDVLAIGGRIIIRDGIMTEPKDQKRVIRFRSDEGMAFLRRYAEDFRGYPIEYEIVGHNEVVMSVNAAMEMLYTYTWGEEAYPHEVQEQFGYCTPTEYLELIHETCGESANIVQFQHFLQHGYSVALSSKIEIFDEQRNPTPLPDSTCLIVIEKRNS